MMLDYQLQLPSSPTQGQPLMILLHGRGATEEDMLALAEFFPQTLFVAARAPFSAAPWGYGPGYAWYRYLGGTRPHPDDFSQAQAGLHAFIQALPQILPVTPGPLVLGGFSQGGTMGLAYSLQQPGVVDLVLNLSGFLADHPAVEVSPETVAQTLYYWPHGLYDPNIPHQIAQEGRGRLREAGADLVAPDFPMPHTIVMEEIEQIQNLITKLGTTP